MTWKGTGGAADTITSLLCLEVAQMQMNKTLLASRVCSSRCLTLACVGKNFQVYGFEVHKFYKQASLFSIKVTYFFLF